MSRGDALEGHFAVRLHVDVLKRIDALKSRIPNPIGLTVHRSHVVRYLIEAALRGLDDGSIKLDDVKPNPITPGRGRRRLHG